MHFTQKFNKVVKNAKIVGKQFFGKKLQLPLCTPCGLKILSKSRTVSEINTLCAFMQKFKMGAKNGGKINFGKQLQMILCTPGGSNISLQLLYLTPFPR